MKKSILTLLLLIILSVFLRAQNISVKVFPNPFRDETTITLPELKSNENVLSQIYNVKGQLVKQWQGVRGSITWNGKDQNNKKVSDGIYFFKLSSGRYTTSRKIILLK